MYNTHMKPSRASVKQKMAMEMKHANKNHISVKQRKILKKKAEKCLRRVQASEKKQGRRSNLHYYGCSVCRKSCAKKKFSKRQWISKKPTCRDCLEERVKSEAKMAQTKERQQVNKKGKFTRRH